MVRGSSLLWWVTVPDVGRRGAGVTGSGCLSTDVEVFVFGFLAGGGLVVLVMLAGMCWCCGKGEGENAAVQRLGAVHYA